MNTITETIIRYQRARAETNVYNKTVVFDALTAAGITSVTVSFDGEGDSGQIEDIHCEGSQTDIQKIDITIRSGDWGCEPIDKSTTLYDGIENFATAISNKSTAVGRIMTGRLVISRSM